MILDMAVKAVQISEGVLTAEVHAKTENGMVALRVGFELKKNKDLDELVPLIDRAVNEALSRVGVKAAAGATA